MAIKISGSSRPSENGIKKHGRPMLAPLLLAEMLLVRMRL
uniref:Uncharacterized protein n=2 Tax=Picea TaxID=3328 RepID=A0A124GNE1_PICGL|nr:hypothetical protein ABT39_MTgene4546 [Picea glauca]QHR92736.1 hypothetical protein Q903MT_gene6784 [Picea sitchensis]